MDTNIEPGAVYCPGGCGKLIGYYVTVGKYTMLRVNGQKNEFFEHSVCDCGAEFRWSATERRREAIIESMARRMAARRVQEV